MKLPLTLTLPLVERGLWLAALLLNIGACGSLLPKPTPQPAFFALQAAVSVARPAPFAATPSPNPVAPARTASTVPVVVLVVQAAKAAPGFDSSRIIYTRQPQRLEYYARSEWIDTPARMLTPLIVAALDRSAAFGAVVIAPSLAGQPGAAAAPVWLEIQLLQLQQEFSTSPSQVRLSWRAQLTQGSNNRVLATRHFEHIEASASEDAAGGVAASQIAAQVLLAELTRWCQQVVLAR